MAHEIFGARMYGRKATWHHLGIVFPQGAPAREALEMIDGDVPVSLRPVTFTGDDGQPVELHDKRVIVRAPTQDDPRYLGFGIVGPGYHLLTHGDVADIIDSSVGQPVETLGVLRDGELLFATVALPEIDIKGDAVERYLGIVSPLDGVGAISAEEWPIRVVCMNTLRIAQRMAQVSYRVRHNAHAKDRLASWVKGAYQKAVEQTAFLKEVFDTLARAQVKEPMAKSIIEYAYPSPRAPRENAPAEVMRKRWIRYERALARQEYHRAEAEALFMGHGHGIGNPSCNGTLFGVLNAVAEHADHRDGRGDDAYQSVARDALFGDGATAKQRSFHACWETAHGNTDWVRSLSDN